MYADARAELTGQPGVCQGPGEFLMPDDLAKISQPDRSKIEMGDEDEDETSRRLEGRATALGG